MIQCANVELLDVFSSCISYIVSNSKNEAERLFAIQSVIRVKHVHFTISIYLLKIALRFFEVI